MTIPDGLRVTLWHDDNGSFTSLPAAQIAAVPTTIGGHCQPGDCTRWLPPDSGPLIRFGFPVTWTSGTSFTETAGLAAELASHLAAMAGDWPSETAYAVLLPVIDFSFNFEVTPAQRKAAPPPLARPSAAGLAERLAFLAAAQRANAVELSAAVAEASAAGMSWRAIGAALGIDGPTVFRQHKAGSPVSVLRPYQSGKSPRARKAAG